MQHHQAHDRAASREATRGLAPQRTLFTALVLLPLFAGCGAESGERRWIHLAKGFVPDASEAPQAEGDVSIEAGAEPGVFWVETSIAGTAWSRGVRPNAWVAPRPLAGGFGHFGAELVRMSDMQGELSIVAPPRPRDPIELVPGDVYLTPESVHLLVAPDARPPDGIRYAVRIDAGRSVEELWTPAIGAYSGEGLWVWPGSEETIELPANDAGTLRFSTVARAFEAQPGDAVERVNFQLLLDDQLLFEAAQGVHDGPRRHEVSVPASRKTRRLTLRTTGPPGLSAFFSPILGPANVGGYRERPWKDPRPNIIVFLIDTFRADNLAVYGGEHGRAPELDRLVERSLTFERTWSPAAWTLPAHVSMLTGLFPKEHGATKKGRALPGALVTLAERLRDHGYRTGAVTDAGFISRNFGLDAGFEWFEETVVDDWDLTQTFGSALEFLARDDGRPVFLYVHTYRTHSPYRHGVEEDVLPWHALMERVRGDLEGPDAPSRKEVRQRHTAEFLELYLEGVEGLDAEFGPWFAALERTGVFEPGYFLLTSDHGEAFGEHGDMVHGGRLWEEKVRVPMLLFGPDIAPGVTDLGASLVDVPKTVASWARVVPDSSWRGRALQELTLDRPVFVYGEEIDALGSRVAIVDGAHKVMGPSDPGELLATGVQHAFDLSSDPGELVNLAHEKLDWPAHLCLDFAEVLEALNQGRTAPMEGQLTEQAARDLEKIGY